MMNHCVYSGPTLQCPTPYDSQSISPVSPNNPPFSGDGSLFHLENFTFDQKVGQPWMPRDDPANSTLYSSTSTRSGDISFQAPINEFQPSGRFSKLNTPKAISNGPLHIQTSVADAQFHVFPVSQSQLDNSRNTDTSFSSQPQPSSQSKRQITQNPPLSASEIPKLLAIAMPKTQAPGLGSPKSPQKIKDRRKRLRPEPNASTSSSTSPNPKPPPPTRRIKCRKINHSVIEKRYRTNLSEKIALLRDCIPSLRDMDKDVSICDTSTSKDKSQGSELARNSNMRKVSQASTTPVVVSFLGRELTESFWDKRQRSSPKQQSISGTWRCITHICLRSGRS